MMTGTFGDGLFGLYQTDFTRGRIFAASADVMAELNHLDDRHFLTVFYWAAHGKVRVVLLLSI